MHNPELKERCLHLSFGIPRGDRDGLDSITEVIADANEMYKYLTDPDFIKNHPKLGEAKKS